MSSVSAPDSKQLPIRFGVALPPTVASLVASLDEHLLLAQAAEAVGLDLIGVVDHPYHSRYLDTLSLIGMLLARSERLHIFPDVANLPLRPPAMLAKAAASLDLLSGGRFELGLGSGGYWDAIKPSRRLGSTDPVVPAVRTVGRGAGPDRQRRACSWPRSPRDPPPRAGGRRSDRSAGTHMGAGRSGADSRPCCPVGRRDHVPR